MPITFRFRGRRHVISDFTIVFTLSLLFALSVTYYAFARYADTPYFYTLVFVAVMGFVVPVGAAIYYQFVQLQNKEYYFPQFLKDLADGVRAGISLPQAVVNVSKINYGPLSEDVRRLATYISWGVPFDEALRRFAQRTGSKMIRASVDLIIEAYTAGGGVADILDTMAEDAGKIRSLKEERKTRFSGFISTIYAVYVIFLLIVVVLINALLPEIPTIPTFGGANAGSILGGFGTAPSSSGIPEDELNAIFFHLAVIEAIFAGLLAGIAGEGTVVAGIKHALILIFIGVAAFQLFIPVPNPVDRLGRAIAKMPINVDAQVHVGKYFLDRNVTAGDVISAAENRMKSMHLPVASRIGVRFLESPRGCVPCAKGYVSIRPDAILVYRPTYLDFTVKTDPDAGVYNVYIS